MGREVRRVPADWKHPVEYDFTNTCYRYVRLRELSRASWRTEWEEYSDEGDSAPDPDDLMPVWTQEEATYWQMYETTSAGTPISPVMPDPESLAHWLADNKAGTFASFTATYEEWMLIIRGSDAFFCITSDGKGEVIIS